MKKLSGFLSLLCLCCSDARATVSIEFQLGALDYPTGSLGVLVADTAGDGFAAISSATGTVLSPGETLSGSDDRIVAVFSLGGLSDWGDRQGFATVLPPLDYAALGVAEGQSLIFYAFPERGPGATIRPDEIVTAYRTDNGAELTGDMGFSLPPDGDAYLLAAIAESEGGTANLSGLGSFGVPLDLGSSQTIHQTVDFGDLEIGERLFRTFLIANRGTVPITGMALTASGSGLPGYSINPLSADTLGAGDSLLLSVAFEPADFGTYQANVRLTGDDPAGDLLVLNLVGRSDHRRKSPLASPADESDDPATTELEDWSSDWDDTTTPIYDGLLRDQAAPDSLLGAINRLVITKPRAGSPLGGSFSTTVRMKGRSAAVRGVFDAQGHFQQAFPQRDGSTVTVDLHLLKTTSLDDSEPPETIHGETIRGTVEWNGVVALADLPRAPFSKTNPLPARLTGPHTVIIPSQSGWGDEEPGGDGWATAQVASTGVLSVLGRLGDGTRFAEAAYLSAESEARLYTELYRSAPERGRFGGKIKFEDQPGVSDFHGLIHWRKFPDAREALYPDGFDLSVWTLGSKYAAPTVRGQRVLDQLANQHHNAELTLIGPTAPGIGGGMDRVLSWLGNNRLVHYGPVGLGALATARSGALSGSFHDPATRIRIAFSGVAFQKQGLAAGVFVKGASSGAVRIIPGTGFDYPGSEAAGLLTRVEPPGTPAPDPGETAEAFTAAAAGLYGGILQTTDSQIIGALEAVTVTASGGVSGVLWLEGVRHGFRGTLDGNPIVIPRAGLPSIELTLEISRIDGSDDGFGMTGNITLAEAAEPLAEVDAQRRPLYSKVNQAPLKGLYTLAMRAPDGVDPLAAPGGDAAGIVSVSYLGNCTGLVILPEGTRVSLGGHLGHFHDAQHAEWSFHRGLYGRVPRGYLAGKLIFRKTIGLSDLDGQWRWVKQAGAAPATVYPNGIDTSRSVVGSGYLAPDPGPRWMGGLNDDWWNLWLRFAGPDLSPLPDVTLTELDRVATWTAANRIVYFGPESVKISFDPRNGLISGSYADPLTGVSFRFNGVLLQSQDLVTGSYRVPGPAGPKSPVSGLFSAEPR